jgi:hypothetical protein
MAIGDRAGTSAPVSNDAGQAGRWSDKKLVAVCSLVAALISAVFTFGNAYLQRESEYSLAKAQYFYTLIDSLNDKDKSNLALLSLWQLFSKKEERKTIVLAAVQVGNSDIIRTLTDLGDELKPYEANLEAAAQSTDARRAEAARRLLNSIDYEKRLTAFMDEIKDQEKSGQRPHLGSQEYIMLRELVTDVPSTTKNLIERYGQDIPKSALLSYLLYETSQDDSYMNTVLEQGIRDPGTFRDHAQVLASTQLRPEHQRQLHYWAKGYLDCSLSGECEQSPMAQSAAIQSLKNARITSYTDSMLRREIPHQAERYLASPGIDELDAMAAFAVIIKWAGDEFALKEPDRAAQLLVTMPRLKYDLSKQFCGAQDAEIAVGIRQQVLPMLGCPQTNAPD